MKVLLVVLSGSQNRASFFQEQITKSGVLVNTGFDDPNAVIQPLEIDDKFSYKNPKTFSQSGGHYTGDWFSSRARSGLYLEGTTAFRGNIEITNKPEFSSGAVPEIVSSLPQNLSYLEFVDNKGVIWFAEGIATGVKTQLQKQSQQASLIPGKTSKIFGTANLASLEKLRRVKNQFVAFANGADSDLYYKTLDSIRWNQQDIVYVGGMQ